ncbi:MAG TPA: histidinol-phosphate transaminase [Gemmatimonadaceae bacterium]|nr:histidinol-phosphate transaminase [Gemmatimonadaceae bacterium]
MSGASGVPSRAALRAVTAYGDGDDAPACDVDLSDNTNLWGAPPAALRAVRDAAEDSLSRYPTLYGGALKSRLAAYVGVAPEEIVTGCGSDDVIDSAMRAFAEPGDRVAHPTPTFSMVPVFARINGLVPVGVPLRDDYDVDADALLATGARIIYLCSPNNPTGTLTSADAVRRVVEHAAGLVVIDEAYAEFADESYASRAPGWERVVVTRTLSKAFGLAGLRVGYGVAAAPLVREIEKARGPYKVTAVAERAACAVLDENLPWVREHAALARANRGRLADALRALGLDALPSAANFLLVATPRAADLARGLRARGVAVRLHRALPGVGDALRVGVGPWPMMQRLLDALADTIGATSETTIATGEGAR